MNSTRYIAASVFVALSVLLIGNDGVIADVQPEVIKSINAVQEVEKTQVSAYDSLTHQQKVWISALEWCESNGIYEAINPNDLDNTPSYYSFQFKPSTFKQYGEKYGVIEKGLSNDEVFQKMKSHELQREIVSYMLNDQSVKLHNQFPACVRKLGLPKRYNANLAINIK